jgi:hypothetical protein
MKQFFKKINRSRHDGFVLLFSVVVSAVIFFIGAGIFAISFKELLISSLGKESQKSIFAADAGVECGLQLDTDGKFLDEDTFYTASACFGFNLIDKYFNLEGYHFIVVYPDKTCAKVTAIKPYDGGPTLTTIYAQGYNKCDDNGPITTYPGLSERVYKVSF